MWAHVYSGPRERIGGTYLAHWATQRAITLLPYIPFIFTSFPPCGTKFFFVFAGDVAACGASDEIASIEAR